MDADVVVVGAGICGLTTALSLVRQGYSVRVLEKRRDNRTHKARSNLDRAARTLGKLNKRIGSATFKAQDLEIVSSTRRRYWGEKERNVLIDERTLETLGALGVDLEDLPQIDRMTIEGVDTTFTLSVPPMSHRLGRTPEDVDIDEALFRRTFSAQPTLGALERRIMASLDEDQNARILFKRRAVRVEEHELGARVFIADGRCIATRYVVIADGGAASSLTNDAVVRKRILSEEPMTVGVFMASAGTRFLDHDVTRGFTFTRFTASGWIAAFSDGRRVTIATNIQIKESKKNDWVSAFLTFVGSFGLCAPLADPPFRTRGETAVAERFAIGNRVLIVGDAAMTGNPRFGLGVRYCMLWAAKVSELFATLREGRTLDVEGFGRFGRMITERRIEFERGWTETIDNLAVKDWSFSNLGVSDFLQGGLRGFELSAITFPGGANVQFSLDLAFHPGSEKTPSNSLNRILRSYSVVAITSNVFLQPGFNGSRFEMRARLSTDNRVVVRLATKVWAIIEGDLRVSRLPDGWEVTVERAKARLSDSSGIDARKPQLELLVAPVGDVRWVFPDRLVDELSGLVPFELTGERLANHQPLRIEFALTEGDSARWGLFHVRAEVDCRLRLSVTRKRNGGVRMSLDVVSGRLTPVDFMQFLRRSGLRSGRWLAELSILAGGTIDAYMDRCAQIAGETIRRVYVDPAPNGGAIATIESILPISIYLSPSDVARLRQDLFSSRAFAQMAETYWRESRSTPVASVES